MASKAKQRSLLTAEILHKHCRYDPAERDMWWIKSGPKRRLDRPIGTVAIRGKPDGRKTYYRQVGISVKPGVYEKHYVHELIWLYMTGEWADPEVDHENRDGLDNRWCNLRIATRSEANTNRLVRQLKGAYFHKEQGKWASQIKHKGRIIYLGFFNTEIEAHEAFVFASKQLNGKFHRA